MTAFGPAAKLGPGDVVKLSLGGVVAADLPVGGVRGSSDDLCDSGTPASMPIGSEVSSVADISIGTVLAVSGIAMTPLAPVVVAEIFGAAVVFAVVLDVVKLPIFAQLRIT